jgi:Mitochondrial biogenesis AIM24/SAM domain (Sterile alpha motif)
MDPSQWSVDDVAEWMVSIGLSHKVDSIKQHHVNGSKLLSMTESDFKSIGLTGLQIRKIQNELPETTEKSSTSAGGGHTAPAAAPSAAEIAALKREMDLLKAQVASLTAAMNSLKAPASNAFTAAPAPSNAPSHSMHVPGFCRDCWIEGNQSQILTVVMGPCDVVQADKGAMVHMSSYIKMSTTTAGQGFGRFMTGESIFLTEYSYGGPPGTADRIAFTPDFAGQIIPVEMSKYGNHIICQKASLLASSPSVQVSIAFSQSLGAGFFGGEGCKLPLQFFIATFHRQRPTLHFSCFVFMLDSRFAGFARSWSCLFERTRDNHHDRSETGRAEDSVDWLLGRF